MLARSHAVTVGLDASDPSGVAYTRYRINGGNWISYTVPFVIAAEGVTSLEFYSADLLGNIEPPQMVDVRIDLTPPASSASAPSAASGSPIPITWSAADSPSGIETVSLWVRYESGTWRDSGLTPQSGATGDFTFSPDSGNGAYCFATVTADKAANVEVTPIGTGDSCTDFQAAVNFIVYLPVIVRK
jgi:hypothetical protein